ncbi:murein hydrolase activator EnvC family protein [Flavobacterium sp.]|uniref:murein hydrolase activator EnvC family protein n=1 Tax=Flavobacterium sp. TaxID=239 RepID=UPI003F6A0855
MKFKLFFLLIFLSSSFVFAQKTTEQLNLEKKKASILKEIQAFKNLLQVEKKKEKSVLTEIDQKNARIRISEKLIETNEKQSVYISNDIKKNQNIIASLTKDLEVLKEDYSKMILKAYKSRSQQSRIMFVLSSKDFLQAYKRIQYMKQYAGYRKSQAEEIKQKQIKLNDAIIALQNKKNQKELIITQTEQEKEVLEKQRLEKEKLVKIIQKDKKKYTAEIDKKDKERKSIDKKIQQTIEQEIARINKRNAEKNKAKAAQTTTTSKTTTTKPAATSSKKFILTAEGKVDSDNFKANKGKLPLPVSEGYISKGYGSQPHPTNKNLTITNAGVEITTKEGSNARVVFDGEVSQIQIIPGSNKKIVYVIHGDFFTIYQNLDTVLVKTGDKVSIKQSLGKVHTNSDGTTILKFLIQQNTTILNPQSWLSL